MYELLHDPDTGRFLGVARTADGSQIPPDTSNADYAAFLAWNAQQVPPLDTSDRPPLTDQERLERTRWAALMGLLTRADEIGIAVRAVLAGLSSGINDRLELIDAQLRALGAAGIPPPVRVLDTEVLAYLQQNPTAGDPLPPPPP